MEPCGAKTRSGTPCLKTPVSGRSRCRLHGGKSLVGPASKTWKHGRYSKLLARIGYDGVFYEAMRDRNLISVRRKMALMDAREAKVLERLRPEGSADGMAAIRDAYAAVMGATAPEECQEHLKALGELLETAGGSDGVVWAELYEVMEVRRKLTETEGKNIERMHKILTADQARAFVAALVSSVRLHVQDTAVLAKIGADFQRLMMGRLGAEQSEE